MKFIKKLWINLMGPILILNSAILIFSSYGMMNASNDIDALGVITLIILILSLLVQIVEIGLLLWLNIWTLVKTIKDKNVLGIILTILLGSFYVPFYHQKKNNWSIVWPIVSVSLLGINYIIFFIGYILYMVSALA